MTRRAIFFDLDGTLTNPYLGIARCIAYALRKVGRPRSGVPYRRLIGPPLQRTFVELCGDTPAARDALQFYRERFTDVGIFENVLYGGVPEMLAELSGIPLFVCTSKPTVYASRIVEHFGLARWIGRVYGSELDGRHTEKSQLLAFALEREKLDPAQCAMIGDRCHDVIAAKANGVQAHGALWGFGEERELIEAGARHVHTTPRSAAAALRAAGVGPLVGWTQSTTR